MEPAPLFMFELQRAATPCVCLCVCVSLKNGDLDISHYIIQVSKRIEEGALECAHGNVTKTRRERQTQAVTGFQRWVVNDSSGRLLSKSNHELREILVGPPLKTL